MVAEGKIAAAAPFSLNFAKMIAYTVMDKNKELNMNDLQSYLSSIVEMQQKHCKNDFVHLSAENILSKYGQEFFPPTKSRPCGAMKECYKNSFNLAMNNKNLIYCEGLALGCMIPVFHAWCIDPNNNNEIVETTWRKPGSAYFGIPFGSEIFNLVSMLGHYGILDNLWLVFNNEKFISNLFDFLNTLEKGK